jgi:hypothetical protein
MESNVTPSLWTVFAAALILVASRASADPIACGMAGYKAAAGLAASIADDTLTIGWTGDRGQDVRCVSRSRAGRRPSASSRFARPAAPGRRSPATSCPTTASCPGLRRMSNQQMTPLRGLGVDLTSDVVDRYRWDPFWDAPLDLTPPSGRGGNPPPAAGVANQPGLPRQPDEIKRAAAIYRVASCAVKTNGARLEIQFPGVQLGVFSGTLQYSIFRAAT